MKLKTLLRNFPVFAVAVVLALLFVIITFFAASKWLAIVELIILVAVVALTFAYFDVFNARKQKLLSHISSNLDFIGGKASNNFPLPIAVCKNDGEIIWYNNLFEKSVIGSNPTGYSELTATFNEMGMDTIINAVMTGLIAARHSRICGNPRPRRNYVRPNQKNL